MLILLQVEAGLLQKEYIAKVIGVFPEKEVPNTLLSKWDTIIDIDNLGHNPLLHQGC